MKWLPFKLTEQEKQAFREVGNDKLFKSFQVRVIFFAVFIIAEIILLWRYYQWLLLLVVIEASAFMAMYARALQGIRMPASLRKKIDTELERQEKEKASALKFRPKVLLFVVLPLVLLLVGVIVYILYSANQEREKMTYGLNVINQEVPEDEAATWQIYRNEEYGFEMKCPDGWTVHQEWWGSAIKSPVFDFKSPKGDREVYIQIENSMFKEFWRGSYDIVTEKEVVIGGVVGSKIVGVFKPTNRQEIFALVKKGENLYHIHFPDFYWDEEFLEQMLSTFRFLE